MILIWLILLPILGAIFALLSEYFISNSARVVAFLILISGVVLLFFAWHLGESSTSMEDLWLLEFKLAWLPIWGIEFHLGMDGLSFVLLLLTYVMGCLTVAILPTPTKDNVGFYYFCLLSIVAGMCGVLLSLDMFLFFVFWEAVLLPIYFMVAIWGLKNRTFAVTQFVVFTQVSGLFLLLSTLALVFINHAQSGIYTFDFNALVDVSLPHPYGFWILWGFLIAFLVKLPAFPFHVWMPPLFSESPAAPLLVGIMVKTGAYGLLRFILPMFRAELTDVRPLLLALGIAGIIYGALLAFSQNNPQKVLAYMTLSHMGLVLVGIFSQNDLALSGVVVLLVAQALSTGALLMLFTQVGTGLNFINLKEVGGIYKVVPGIGVLCLFFVMASLGVPGFANFVGEWLVLLGIFSNYTWISVIAASGIVLGTVYLLWLMQRLFYGPYKSNLNLVDVNLKQKMLYGVMVILLVLIGFHPAPLLDVVSSVWQEDVAGMDELVLIKKMSLKHNMKVGALYDP